MFNRVNYTGMYARMKYYRLSHIFVLFFSIYIMNIKKTGIIYIAMEYFYKRNEILHLSVFEVSTKSFIRRSCTFLTTPSRGTWIAARGKDFVAFSQFMFSTKDYFSVYSVSGRKILRNVINII